MNAISPSCVLGILVKDQLAMKAWLYLWALHSVPFFSVCFCQYYTLSVTAVLQGILKSKDIMPLALLFLLSVALLFGIISGSNFCIVFSISMKNAIEILMGFH